MGSSSEAAAADGEEEQRSKARRWAKIILPHLGLSLFILGYLLFGAWAIQRLEREEDSKKVEARAYRIIAQYEGAETALRGLCQQNGRPFTAETKAALYAGLDRLSSLHQGRQVRVPTERRASAWDVLERRWSFYEATLYALSILTTTGYTRVDPASLQGQLFAVVYGLFGIPVMVLTAVDIGRFLSNGSLFLWAKVRARLGSSCLRRRRKAPNPLHTAIRTRLLDGGGGEGQGRRRSEVVLEEEALRRQSGENLPLAVNASVLLLFCTIGAGCYMVLLRNVDAPGFSQSFFVTFNLVANLTMGEIPLVKDIWVLLFIVFFVSFGLAVLSMCAELAASELKWIFMKIHYFGRKMRRRQESRALAEVGALDVEVAELLKIIDEIRTKYPDKRDVTPADILAHIHEVGALGSRRRRLTHAFIPDSMDGFRFADADDPDTQAQIPSFGDSDDDDDLHDPTLSLDSPLLSQ